MKIVGTVAVLLVIMLFGGCSGNAAQDEADMMRFMGGLMLQSNASQEDALPGKMIQKEFIEDKTI